jgi:predicted nucleic acid-binding protein
VAGSKAAWTIAELRARHPRIAVDADVLIYLLDGSEPRAGLAGALIDAIDSGVIVGSMSALTLTEVLVGPARAGDAARFEQTAFELRDLDLSVVPISTEIAEHAAWLRGREALQLADAVHVAAAQTVATAFVTNDRRIRSQPGLEVMYLDDLIA